MSNWIYFLTEASVALVTEEDVRLTITSDYTTLTPLTFPSPFSRFKPPLPPRGSSYLCPTSPHYQVLPSCAASDFGHPMKYEHLRTRAFHDDLLWRYTVIFRLSCEN